MFSLHYCLLRPVLTVFPSNMDRTTMAPSLITFSSTKSTMTNYVPVLTSSILARLSSKRFASHLHSATVCCNLVNLHLPRPCVQAQEMPRDDINIRFGLRLCSKPLRSHLKRTFKSCKRFRRAEMVLRPTAGSLLASGTLSFRRIGMDAQFRQIKQECCYCPITVFHGTSEAVSLWPDSESVILDSGLRLPDSKSDLVMIMVLSNN